MQRFAIDHPEHGSGEAARILTDPRPSNLWSLRMDSGGTVRFIATREQISDWTNARHNREQEDNGMSKPAPKTIDIRPTARLVERAMQWAEIPLGDSLKIERSGSLSFDFEGDDLNQVLSGLTGLVLSSHATATMVLPSNAKALTDAVKMLQGVLTEARRGALGEGTLGTLEDAVEILESVTGNLDGLKTGS